MTHDELANHLGLTLAQVEWSFALLMVINDLSNITDTEKRGILISVCGSPPSEDWILPWGKVWESWNNIQVESEILYWLITGLNQDSTDKIYEALRKIEQDQIIQETSIQNNECVIPPPLSVPQPQGELIIQTFSKEHMQWGYHTPYKSWYLTDIHQEPHLLETIQMTMDSSRPIGLLRIQQDRPSRTLSNSTVVNFETLNFHLKNHSSLKLGSIEHSLHIEIQAPGGFTEPFPLAKKHPRSVQKSFQKSGRWSVTLEQINGPPLPMIWNLESRQHQSSRGNGGRGGTIQFLSNAFTQIYSDSEWLDGTSPHKTNTDFPKIVGEQFSSHRAIWLADEESIDLSGHVSSFSTTVKPIFDETPRLNHILENRKYIQGTGYSLTAELFVEMNLQCEQTDISKRTCINATNVVTWNVTGSLEWCGNKLQIEPNEFDLIWKCQEHTAFIRCQTELPLQSVKRRVTSGDNEYCYSKNLSTVDSRWELMWDTIEKE